MPAIGKSEKKAPTEKKPGIIKKTLGAIRKKIAPTFPEQFTKAKEGGKKEFRSTRAKKKGEGWFGKERGRLHYATTDKPKVEKKIVKAKKAEAKIHSPQKSEKKTVYEKATGTKVSERGQAFAAARKAGKKEFTYKGKKYHTRLKGEEKDKPTIDWKKKKVNIKLPELSGGTAKKIKRAIGAQAGGRIADAARRAQIHGFYSPDMGMRGRGPGMPGPNVMGGRDPRMAMRDPGMARGRGYAKGGLIKGKPKLAVKGW